MKKLWDHHITEERAGPIARGNDIVKRIAVPSLEAPEAGDDGQAKDKSAVWKKQKAKLLRRDLRALKAEQKWQELEVKIVEIEKRIVGLEREIKDAQKAQGEMA